MLVQYNPHANGVMKVAVSVEQIPYRDGSTTPMVDGLIINETGMMRMALDHLELIVDQFGEHPSLACRGSLIYESDGVRCSISLDFIPDRESTSELASKPAQDVIDRVLVYLHLHLLQIKSVAVTLTMLRLMILQVGRHAAGQHDSGDLSAPSPDGENEK